MSSASFRELLAEPGVTQVMGAHDGLMARIAQQSGFRALYVGSYAIASTFGVPDIGLTGLQDAVDALQRVAGAADVALLIDADTGYGNEASVDHTVRTLERAGASAIQIEDQVSPKRCGHMAGKEVIGREDAVAKIRAAVAARRDPETVIVARTDSLQAHGIGEAVARCERFAEAGADVVFIDAPESVEQLRTAASVTGDTMVNMTETGRTPLLAAGELEAMGFAVIIYPSNQIWSLAGAYRRLCSAIIQDGKTDAVQDEMLSFDEVNELLGLSHFQALES